MANIDEHGSKIAQIVQGKKIQSKAFRILRTQQGEKINPAFCNECGFRVRSEGHLEGGHHNGTVISPRKRH